MPRHKHAVVKMNPNPPRIREAILHLIRLADRQSAKLTQYEIVKSLFLADRSHLNKYGRPVTYDNYVAMVHGPVPSFAYDLLKENRRCVELAGGVLWSRILVENGFGRHYEFSNAVREASEDVLAPSDFRCLDDAYTIIRTLSFGQIRKLTHEDQAYLDAWEDRDDVKQFPMSYALLFDGVNDEMAEHVSISSNFVQ